MTHALKAIACDLVFVAFGHPQGKGSKRVIPIRSAKPQGDRVVLADSNRNAKPWEARVASAAAEAMMAEDRTALMRGGVEIGLDFYFARPKSHYRTGRNARLLRSGAPAHMATMPDCDKLARCALDALTKVVIADDAQVCSLTVRKLYGEPERLEVQVCEL